MLLDPPFSPDRPVPARKKKMSSMSVLLELSGLDSSSGGNLDCGDRDNRNRRVQPVRVAISGHEVSNWFFFKLWTVTVREQSCVLATVYH